MKKRTQSGIATLGDMLSEQDLDALEGMRAEAEVGPLKADDTPIMMYAQVFQDLATGETYYVFPTLGQTRKAGRPSRHLGGSVINVRGLRGWSGDPARQDVLPK